MAITPLPDVPQRGDQPDVFIARADAFIAALVQFRSELNDAANAMNLYAVSSVSTTNLTISVASKTLTVEPDKSFLPGQTVKIASTSDGAKWMLGDVMSYDVVTGALVVSVNTIQGSGTFAAWTISLSAPGGASLNGSVSQDFSVRNLYQSLGADIASAGTINLDTATGDTVDVTGTTAITAITLSAGRVKRVRHAGSHLLTHSASLILPGGKNIQTQAGDYSVWIGYPGGVVRCLLFRPAGGLVGALHAKPSVRQTVSYGPVDSNGAAAFGGATGSTTVTASGTLSVTSANGDSDLNGSIVNPSWTGLNTDGTYYLYLDIAADGTCTTGSTALEPIYQPGGAYSVTNGQCTFNIGEMTMKVGNGSTANQVYRVFVGEVVVASNVVSAITWYALNGRFDAPWTATLPGTATLISNNHNIGVSPRDAEFEIECTTADAGYAVGDRILGPATGSGSLISKIPCMVTRKTISVITGSSAAWYIFNKSTGSVSTPTSASWKFRMTAKRGW